jgi:hypothetical protein
MHRRVSFLFLMSVLALACSSGGGTPGSGRPPNIVQPEIQVGLANALFFGSTNNAPANIDVMVTNRATVPITVRRIDVDSPGMSTYTLQRVARDYREVVAPGETKRLTVFATAVTSVSRPNEPLTLRALVDFEVGKDRWREIVMTR